MSEPWTEGDGPVFFDTNVLFYAFDRDAGGKHDRASNLVTSFFETDRGVVSVQVLQELTVNLRTQFSQDQVQNDLPEIISSFLSWTVIVPDGEDVLASNRLCSRFQFHFWDAMMLRTAQKAEAKWVLTEDLQHQQSIDDMTIFNPF